MSEIWGPYGELVKKHIPPLLEKIAAKKPHAIVFLDRSARPFAWLTQHLWRKETHGPMPAIRFIEGTRIDWKGEDAKTRKKTIAKWAEKNKLKGKTVVLFDDLEAMGANLFLARKTFEQAGIHVIPAVFSRTSIGSHDLVGTHEIVIPPWLNQIPLGEHHAPEHLHVHGNPLKREIAPGIPNPFARDNRTYMNKFRKEAKIIAEEIRKARE